ncbi:MAG: hypothetical protein ACP5P1_14170 [Acidimicrobiales bacterium]
MPDPGWALDRQARALKPSGKADGRVEHQLVASTQGITLADPGHPGGRPPRSRRAASAGPGPSMPWTSSAPTPRRRWRVPSAGSTLTRVPGPGIFSPVSYFVCWVAGSSTCGPGWNLCSWAGSNS